MPDLYWWLLFWEWGVPAETSIEYFMFDGYALSAWAYRVRTVDYDDLWTIDLQTFNSPMIDWGGVLSQLYRSKTVTFNMSITASTLHLLNDAIDWLKKYTMATEWRLEISVNWVVRRCKASRTSLEFNRKSYSLTFVSDVILTFVTLDPHWTEKTATTSVETLTWDKTYTVDNTWTAPVFPITYINFDTWNASITSVSLTLGGNTMTITEAFADWDILTIDWGNKRVKKNNTLIDYDWVFEPLDPWENIVDVAFNWWATVSAELTTSYFKTYY